LANQDHRRSGCLIEHTAARPKPGLSRGLHRMRTKLEHLRMYGKTIRGDGQYTSGQNADQEE
jgi:hypothetical protein